MDKLKAYVCTGGFGTGKLHEDRLIDEEEEMHLILAGYAAEQDWIKGKRVKVYKMYN